MPGYISCPGSWDGNIRELTFDGSRISQRDRNMYVISGILEISSLELLSKEANFRLWFDKLVEKRSDLKEVFLFLREVEFFSFDDY